MNIFVVEDELPARDRLIATIGRVAPTAAVVGVAGSVADARGWLATHPLPDVMLLDIQLSDGLSLQLFEHGSLNVPVIFATAYNRFVLEAFDANAIGYLLKPVGDEALARSLAAYSRLRAHFDGSVATMLAGIAARTPPRCRRVISRSGSGYAPLCIESVAYFISLDKCVYAVDRAGARHRLDATLADLGDDLDPQQYFRATRQLIVAVDAVIGYRAVGKGCIAVQLRPPLLESVVVAQERASAFKAWLGS